MVTVLVIGEDGWTAHLHSFDEAFARWQHLKVRLVLAAKNDTPALGVGDGTELLFVPYRVADWAAARASPTLYPRLNALFVLLHRLKRYRDEQAELRTVGRNFNY